MPETGMHLDAATQIYQDNDAAIQIELNRGSLGSHSRHIPRKVPTSRNKVEDGDIVPVYKRTNLIPVDTGTKALPDARFEYLRDQMNGHSLIKMNRASYAIPSYVV